MAKTPTVSTLAQQNAFYLQLLFDEELRERFFYNPLAACLTEGISDEAAQLFLHLDKGGLLADVNLRKEYLMSALCRPFPLTAAALGSGPGGAQALSAFLTSASLRGPVGERTKAFGTHLERVLSFARLSPPITRLISALLEFERSRVENAAAIRAAVDADPDAAAPPSPASTSRQEKGHVKLPPFLLVTELPQPTSVVKGALGNVDAGNAWHQIANGALHFDRFVTVARALDLPVTVLSRGVASGHTQSAGQMEALVDVRHLTAEISGRVADQLRQLDGQHSLGQLPPALQRLALPLVEGGLLDL